MATTSKRSEAMKAAWEARRSEGAKVARWLETPICLCGCGAPLKKAKSATAQSNFRPGHDSVLHGLATKVLRGEADLMAIPEVARLLRRRIGFLKTNSELMKVIAGVAPPKTRRITSAA